MKNVVKKIWIGLRSLLILILLAFCLTSSIENIEKTIQIERFKSKAVYDEVNSTSTMKFYKIKSDEKTPTFIYDGATLLPGNTGDILVSTDSRLHPIIKGFVSFFAGGHAALCLDDYDDGILQATKYDVIESTGLKNKDEGYPTVITDRSYWSTDQYYSTCIGLRVKITDDQKQKLITKAMSMVGTQYNFSFIFNTKKKTYCSDLIAKCYKNIGVNLNKDGFTTSIYDLILSNKTYISYYHYFDNGIQYIYYLG